MKKKSTRNILSKGDSFYLVDENEVEYNSNRDFTSLEAWKKSGIVKLFFYNSVLPELPNEETCHPGAQIRDASVSCTSNIAEGMVGIISRKEFNSIEFPELHYMN